MSFDSENDLHAERACVNDLKFSKNSIDRRKNYDEVKYVSLITYNYR